MDKAALDKFFADADDVLDNWQPNPYDNPDVMYAEQDAEFDDSPVDSYYAQMQRRPFATYRHEAFDALIQRHELARSTRQHEAIERMQALIDQPAPAPGDVVTYEVVGSLIPPVPPGGRIYGSGSYPRQNVSWNRRGPSPDRVIIDEQIRVSIVAAADEFLRIIRETGEEIARAFEPLREFITSPPPRDESPFDRAMRIRRERANHGPAPRRLDGRRDRHAT